MEKPGVFHIWWEFLLHKYKRTFRGLTLRKLEKFVIVFVWK